MFQSRSLSGSTGPRAAVVADSRGARDRDALGDADLLALVLRGDAAALAVVYDRYIEAVWALALHCSKSRTIAEDAVSAVFLRLWRAPQPGSRASLGAWLLASVAREAHDRRRSTGARA